MHCIQPGLEINFLTHLQNLDQNTFKAEVLVAQKNAVQF